MIKIKIKKLNEIYIKYKQIKNILKFENTNKKNNSLKTQKELNSIKNKILKLNKKYDKQKIKNDIKKIHKKIEKLKKKCFFTNKNDIKNCYLNIQSGSGGIEAQDWSSILLKMYNKWAIKKKFKTKIINQNIGEFKKTKSATLFIKGKYAYGYLKNETGVHRLVRKNPFNTNKKRHTSFSSIYIYPETKKKKKNIILNNSEIKIDVYKSSGTGGQHVNKTESAVRITHIPTNIKTQCQKNRSQHKNKKQAIKQIKKKLNNLKLFKENKLKKKTEKQKAKIEWGNQIRSYILDNSIIKDTKSKIETNKIQDVLNGKIDIFLEKTLEINYREKNEFKNKKKKINKY